MRKNLPDIRGIPIIGSLVTKRLQAKQKKKQEEKRKDKATYAAPPGGLVFTPSYIRAGDRWGTVLRFSNKFGMNRGYEFGWFTNLFPSINVSGVKAYVVVDSKPTTEEEQEKIEGDIIPGNMLFYGHSTKIQKRQADREKRSERTLRQKARTDYEVADAMTSNNGAVIDARIQLLLTGDSIKSLAFQMHRLDTQYTKKMNGLTISSAGGTQKENFQKLLEPPDENPLDFTWVAQDFAGNNHFVRRGLNDPAGLPVGSMQSSHAMGAAFFDLDGSLKSSAIVAAHSSSYIRKYDKELSSTSMWGQLIANHVMFNHHKAHHIILNGWQYKPDYWNTLDDDFKKIVTYRDLSKGGLNPIEMFGELDEVEDIFNSNIKKIGNIFYLLSGRAMSEAQRGALTKALTKFYENNGMWDPKHPKRANGLNTEKHDGVPTLSDFTMNIENMLRQANGSTEMEKYDAATLQTTLENALNQQRQLFGKTSTVPNPVPDEMQELQFFYDITKLNYDQDIMEAQFLNAFSYIVQGMQKGDAIFIHGMNEISVETLDVIVPQIKRLKRNGMRIVYLFDEIGGSSGGEEVELANIFNTRNRLYSDFEGDFNFSILGNMTNDEYQKYESLINQKLSQEVANNLTSSDRRKFQIRRPDDMTNNFVNAYFVL